MKLQKSIFVVACLAFIASPIFSAYADDPTSIIYNLRSNHTTPFLLEREQRSLISSYMLMAWSTPKVSTQSISRTKPRIFRRSARAARRQAGPPSPSARQLRSGRRRSRNSHASVQFLAPHTVTRAGRPGRLRSGDRSTALSPAPAPPDAADPGPAAAGPW